MQYKLISLSSTAVQWGHLSSKNWVVTSTKWSGHRYDLWKIRRDSDFEKSKVSKFEAAVSIGNFTSLTWQEVPDFHSIMDGNCNYLGGERAAYDRGYEAPYNFTNSCKIFHEN